MAGKEREKKLGWIGKLAWLFNIFLVILLFASYLAGWIDPGKFSAFAFLGLVYPIILVANLVFIFIWIVRGKWHFLLSLAVVIAGYGPLGRYVQLLPGKEAPDSNELVKVMSYNVQNMAHSNFGRADEQIRDKIYGFIRSQEADIICLQEFSSAGSDTESTFSDLISHSGHRYYSYANYIPGSNRRLYAIVTLSKHPILSSRTLSLPDDHHNFGIFNDMVLDNDTIRFYNLHLESIRLQHEDYQFVEDMSKGQTEKGSLSEGSKSIITKLHNAYKLRARQAKMVRQSIAECRHPVVVCGDFNDTPLSYAYSQIGHELKDAFVGAGFGRGNTFEGKLPAMRIDYIMHSEDLTPYEFRVHHSELSDHYPLTVYFGK